MQEQTTRIRLYVEGRTDHEFFLQLLEREGMKDKIFVKTYGGTTRNLKNNHLIPLRTSAAYIERAFQVVGVVTDADNYPDRAFQSVRDALRAAGFSFPTAPQKLSDPDVNGVQSAILVLPSAEQMGAIEDLFLQAFTGYGVLQCLEQYEESFKRCLVEKGIALRESRVAKAKFQMLLAATGGELSLKDALKKRDWFPWESGAFGDIKDFLTMLADATTP